MRRLYAAIEVMNDGLFRIKVHALGNNRHILAMTMEEHELDTVLDRLQKMFPEDNIQLLEL